MEVVVLMRGVLGYVQWRSLVRQCGRVWFGEQGMRFNGVKAGRQLLQ
jgi:hypothetical protein